MVFILAETVAGYAIFEATDKAMKNGETLARDLASVEKATSILRLKTLSKFENIADALDNISAIAKGKVSPKLASLLQDLDDKSSSLIVSDPKLGTSIRLIPKLNFEIIADSSTTHIYRAIRMHMSSLIPELASVDLKKMSLDLSHSFSHQKLDKGNTMVGRAIRLLDDLDNTLNTYSMKAREWYEWHFPETEKIVKDNLAYAQAINFMGAASTDFSTVLPEDVAAALQSAAEVSMGTEISQSDLHNILLLVEQIISLSAYRSQLHDYICSQMRTLAPNLLKFVDEMIGARLIAQAGGLVELAKLPASTIQILGAEKSFYAALKSQHPSPKYGYIYQSEIVRTAPVESRSRVSRSLAAKIALAIRCDAFANPSNRNNDSTDIVAVPKNEEKEDAAMDLDVSELARENNERAQKTRTSKIKRGVKRRQEEVEEGFSDGDGGDGDGGGGLGKRKPPVKRRRRQNVENEYDAEGFIDGSEAFMEQVALSSKDGAFVCSGPLLADGGQAKIDKAKQPKKRKALAKKARGEEVPRPKKEEKGKGKSVDSGTDEFPVLITQ